MSFGQRLKRIRNYRKMTMKDVGNYIFQKNKQT